MKKIFVFSMLVSLVMICSCQKQDSATEQQLAQRKRDLDAREKVFDERETGLVEREKALIERSNALSARQKALDERQKSLGQKEKATMNTWTNRTDVQVTDPAQVEAERNRMIQQLPPELNPGPSQLNALKAEKAEKEREMQQQLAQTQPRPEELKQPKLGALGTSGGVVFPSAAATSPTPSPAVEATSPSASPTPQ